MIARIWRGWAPQATSGDYQRHYETEVIMHLQCVDGFRGARLLRQDDGPEVMFTSLTFFTGIEGFSGSEMRRRRAAFGRCRSISTGCWPGRSPTWRT